MDHHHAAAPGPSVAATLEQTIRWPAASTLGFVGVLVVLVAAGVVPQLARPPAAVGLPDNAQVFEAVHLLRDAVAFPTEGLRFRSSLYGVVPGHERTATDMDRRLDEAERALDTAPRRLRSDPRWIMARASVDLARHHFRNAATRYERALGSSGDCAEARLGLGLALALSARFERHPLTERRTTLRAIAQFAAITPDQEPYELALYNRVILLDRVGRFAEARQYAAAYLERDGSSPWADRMRDVIRRPGT